MEIIPNVIDWGFTFMMEQYPFIFGILTALLVVFIHYQLKAHYFRLKFSLTENFNKSDWEDVDSFSDIISGGDYVWNVESRKSKFFASKIDELSVSIGKKSIQAILYFYLNLSELKSKNLQVDSLKIDSILKELNELALEKLKTSGEAIREKATLFRQELSSLQANSVPPITDLTPYLDTGCIIGDKFKLYFSQQVNTNLALIDKLDVVTLLRPSLQNITVIAKACTRYTYKLSTEDMNEMNQLHDILVNLKDALKMNLEFIQARYEALENSFTNLDVEYIRNKNGVLYFDKHADELNRAFSIEGSNQDYPFRIPNITQYSDNLLEIRNEAEYKKVKSMYTQLAEASKKYSKFFNQKLWKTTSMPNFSSNDLHPYFLCATQEDFELILTVYWEYQKKLEFLKQSWHTSLRTIVTVIGPLNELLAKSNI